MLMKKYILASYDKAFSVKGNDVIKSNFQNLNYLGNKKKLFAKTVHITKNDSRQFDTCLLKTPFLFQSSVL